MDTDQQWAQIVDERDERIDDLETALRNVCDAVFRYETPPGLMKAFLTGAASGLEFNTSFKPMRDAMFAGRALLDQAGPRERTAETEAQDG